MQRRRGVLHLASAGLLRDPMALAHPRYCVHGKPLSECCNAPSGSAPRPVSLDVRTGLKLRLLICTTCRAVWPTERDERHGGSRQDGEPCAYVWRDTGKVCGGVVHPIGVQPAESERRPFAPPLRVYSGRWCEPLGVPAGTTDLAAVRKAYRAAAKRAHPDAAGGSHQAMLKLNEAYRQALAELGQP